MDDERFDRRARTLAHAERPSLDRSVQSPRLGALARALGAAATRRTVLGGTIAAALSRLTPGAGAVARQGETCRCPNPVCFLRALGRDPHGLGQLAAPGGVAVAPDGTVYVADLNRRIQVFEPDGTFMLQWPTGRTGLPSFPSGLAVAADGTVYLTDFASNRVAAFATDGTLLSPWRIAGDGAERVHPAGVAVGPDGTVYVADAGSHRIEAFCPTPEPGGERSPATHDVGVPGSPVPAATPVGTTDHGLVGPIWGHGQNAGP